MRDLRTSLIAGALAAVLWIAAAGPASALVPAPTISGFAPSSGAPGTLVTINGTNFSKVKAVKFDGVAAAHAVKSATKITATVPPTATTGRITVKTAAGTAVSVSDFVVNDPALSVSASSGAPGSSLTVSGQGFGVRERVDIYLDTNDLALAATDGTGSFSGVAVTVPADTPPGAQWISAEGRHSGLFAQTAFTVGTDWPQFRGSPVHRGVNPSENVLSPSTVGGIDVDWSHATGNGVFSSPEVVAGVVYVGSLDGKIYALNASTGATIWSFATGGPVEAPVAVVGGIVYGGSEDGKVYALDAATGSLVWSFTTGSFIQSPATVLNGVVYIGSDDGKVYALDASSGAPVWTFATGGFVKSSPAVVGGRVFVGSDDHIIYALDAATGTELWQEATGNAVESSAAVVNGIVYIGSFDGTVRAFRSTDGAFVWGRTLGGGVYSSPAVVNGTVYVGADDQKVYALSAIDGSTIWSYTTGGNVDSSPAVANGVVYIGSRDARVYAFDATTGARLWSYLTGSDVASSPAVVNGTVYVGSSDDSVYAFDLAGGSASRAARPTAGALHAHRSVR